MLDNFGSRIKERGLYVDCNDSTFAFPEVDREKVMKMGELLFSLLSTSRIVFHFLNFPFDIERKLKMLSKLRDSLKEK